jgi:hypothetical protein
VPGGDTYRFLLRMPQELRDRIAESAGSSGRSLNAEIVHRLDESLEAPAPQRRTKGEYTVKKLRSRRPLIALALVVLAAVAVAAFGARQGHAPGVVRYLKSDPDARGVISTAGNLGSPSSWAAEEVAANAYPSSSLKASQMNNERNDWHGKIQGRGDFHSDRGWQLVGPSTATSPAVLNTWDNNLSDLGVSGRVTALALDPGCDTHSCQVWLAAAGGGIWRSQNALSSNPHWTFLSDGFGTNAIGTLTYDPRTRTLYAGTGEPNSSQDSEAGVGIYASRDNGDHWQLLPGSFAAMQARAISSIVVDPRNPNTLYVSTMRAVRGVASVTGGGVSLAPDAAPWGLYKTTDGGRTFNEIWNGDGTGRGINHVEIDAAHGNTIYASAMGLGIFRSADGGTTWEQIFATKDVGDQSARDEFALNQTSDGHTRIYIGDGGTEIDQQFPPHSNSGVYRADAIDATPAAVLLTSGTDAGYVSLTDPAAGRAAATYDYCETQCWYDNYVVSPAGHPDDVYVGGSFDYNLFGNGVNNGRAVLLSTNAGTTWNDQTRDAQPAANGIHPDQHALVVDPQNPLLFFEGSDGGIVHSSGQLTDTSSQCNPSLGPYSTTCTQLLSAVPTKITPINQGLSTLQYQDAMPNPNSAGELIGGTQDNGTWLGRSNQSSWNQTIYGDGGNATFDSKKANIDLTEFYGQSLDVNFQDGNPTTWTVVSGPLYGSGEISAFYKPTLADPVNGGTLYTGLQHVFRTQDDGGSQSYLESTCPEFTTFANDPNCGDFVALGDPSGHGGANTPGDLTSTIYGADRSGGYVAAIQRTTADKTTLWAATATGRVFISKNANAPTPGAVLFTRLDSTSTAAPGRFVSGIVVDPTNANRAWITYMGYNENTPTTPGHVFQVDYNPLTQTATWTDIDNGTGPIGDLPVDGITRDDATGTLYVATDFTVLADSPSRNGSFDGNWRPAAGGLPEVEVAGVAIDQRTRTLYAATHGRAIWQLQLPGANSGHH